MKQKRNKREGSSLPIEMGIGALLGIGTLALSCTLGALVLLALPRPVEAIAMTALVCLVVGGGIGGVLHKKGRGLGVLGMAGALCLTSILLTKGQMPVGVPLGYAAYLGAYFLVSQLPRGKKTKKRRNK